MEEYIVRILVSVIASIISHFACKWLDSDSKGQ